MEDGTAFPDSKVFLLPKMTYKEQLAHPKWQLKRLKILERDKATCQICGDTETTLHIHHKTYDKTYQTKAWEYPDSNYTTLCMDCHKALTEHIEEYGTDKEFDVMKVKRSDGLYTVFVYSNGMLRFNVSGFEGHLNFTENTTHKIVQFLINNWLKNG